MAVSLAKSRISWNAADSNGVTKVGLKIDGKVVSQINGPYAAASGVNYFAKLGSLMVGKHAYIITATDKYGKASTLNGSFTMTAPPKISGVVTGVANRLLSWKVAAAAGLAGYSLKIDGTVVSGITAPGASAQLTSGRWAR